MPEWNLPQYSKISTVGNTVVVKENVNPSDGVMGEPIIDVLSAMGFGVSGGVYNKRVWYRIKCEKYGIVEYSNVFEATAFRAPEPTIKKDYSGFMRIQQNPANPGVSILGTVGWNNADKSDEGVDNPNWADAIWTTIVEYSRYSQAYQSNEQPNSIEIDWSTSAKTHEKRFKEYANLVKNGMFTTSQSGGTSKQAIKWKKSADFAIYGLEPGVDIYLWTRRHMVLGEYDLYGPRSSAPDSPKGYFPFVPIDNPTEVAIYISEYYVYGEDLTVSWAHNATCEQKTWNVYLFPAEDMDVYEVGVTNVSSIPLKMVAAGTGKKSFTTISGREIVKHFGKNACIYQDKKAFSIIKNLGVAVGVSTGGKEILSLQDSKDKYIDVLPMTIVHPPTCAVWVPYTVSSTQMRKIYLFTKVR